MFRKGNAWYGLVFREKLVKTYLDCYPCFLQQALRAARLSGADETQQYSIMQYSLSLLRNLPSGANPPEIGYHIHQIVSDMVDIQDPYREEKEKSTQQAKDLNPKMKPWIQQSRRSNFTGHSLKYRRQYY